MRIYKMFMRNLVNYPWIGPDVVVVVIKIGNFKFITSNYEIRPDRLIEYKSEVYRWGSGGFPQGKLTMLHGTKIKFPSILQYWDSRLDYTENLKLQKEFDNMMFGNPFKNIDQYPKSIDLKLAWKKVLKVYKREPRKFISLCDVIYYCRSTNIIDYREEEALMFDMEKSARRDWQGYGMYNPNLGGFRWKEGDKEIRIKFIKTRIDELERSK